MYVVVDIVSIHSEIRRLKVNKVFIEDKLNLKKLWNIDDESKQKPWKDEGEEVDEGGCAKLVSSV